MELAKKYAYYAKTPKKHIERTDRSVSEFDPDPNQFKQRQFYTFVMNWSKNVNKMEYYDYYFTEIYLRNSLYLYWNFVLCFLQTTSMTMKIRSSYIFWRKQIASNWISVQMIYLLYIFSLFHRSKWFVIIIKQTLNL